MTRIAVWVLITATGCTTPMLETTESPIRGGTVDDGDPAVAALSVLGLYSYCTATLIAPHTVLTAGHCNLTGIEADFGTDADSPAQSIDIADVKVHPSYTGEGKAYDFALMKLASDPVGIAPLRLNGAPLAADQVGQMIRHVGFGVTDDATSDGGGTKRSVTFPVHRIESVLLYSGGPDQQTCTGDSGGPGLMRVGTQELVVSVVSDGPDCQLSQDGWDDRVDVVKDWIVQTTTAWDAPPSFGAGDDDADDGGGPGPGDVIDPATSDGGCAVGGGSHASWMTCAAVLGLALRRRRRAA